jgi:hypothetical protein
VLFFWSTVAAQPTAGQYSFQVPLVQMGLQATWFTTVQPMTWSLMRTPRQQLLVQWLLSVLQRPPAHIFTCPGRIDIRMARSPNNPANQVSVFFIFSLYQHAGLGTGIPAYLSRLKLRLSRNHSDGGTSVW